MTTTTQQPEARQQTRSGRPQTRSGRPQSRSGRSQSRSGRPQSQAGPAQASTAQAGSAQASTAQASPPSGPPIAVSGLLDLSDGKAFIRHSGYQHGPDDVYLTPAQVQQYALRMGDYLEGAARPPRPGQPHDKHPALTSVDTVNGETPQQAAGRPEFAQLTPLYPQERLHLEGASASPTARIIDLVAPIGKGQRGLIVSPPKAGKTMVLQAIAAAVAANHPEVHLMVVLVGERPEEVTDLRRSVHGEVIYSTFDQSAQEHIAVAELAIERAKRLVEQGRDVVVLLDSITRLGRAYNLAAPTSSRILAGGVAVSALYPPRKFLGAARNVEHGGSLTLLCTALVETGSRMDDVFFEEFKGTGNMELRLRRELAEKRIFPAIDVAPSSTRRDDLLMSAEEHAVMSRLRQVLAELEPQQAIELLLDKARSTASNAEFLRQIQRSSS
jgi:transcription termination factor Rho